MFMFVVGTPWLYVFLGQISGDLSGGGGGGGGRRLRGHLLFKTCFQNAIFLEREKKETATEHDAFKSTQIF